MVFDWDDYSYQERELGQMLTRLERLKEIRPEFKCTLFTIPNPGSRWYWEDHPHADWIELAVHGWNHFTPVEATDWTVEEARSVIVRKPYRFARGFKAPGWQISDGTYAALLEAGWWVADQPYNDDRRPPGLPVHRLNVGPDHWHGHVQNVCGNGLEETWDEVVALVKAAPSFEFMSEVVQPWVPAPVAA